MARNAIPEFAETFYASFRRISRDERRVDGTNRNSGYPFGFETGGAKGFVCTTLISAESAAALQHENGFFSALRCAAVWLGHVVDLPSWGWLWRRRGSNASSVLQTLLQCSRSRPNARGRMFDRDKRLVTRCAEFTNDLRRRSVAAGSGRNSRGFAHQQREKTGGNKKNRQGQEEVGERQDVRLIANHHRKLF